MSGEAYSGVARGLGDFANFVWLIVSRACSQSLDRAQGVLFLLFIIIAFVPQDAPYSKFADKYASWHGGIIVLCCVMLVRLVLAPYWIYRDQAVRIAALEEETAGSADNTAPQPLVFEFGHEAGFVKKAMLANGSYRYEGIVKLRNRGNGFLTSVMVQIKSSSPPLPDGSFRVLKPGSTLQRGEPANVYFATYFDNIEGSAASFIRLACPVSPGWGSRATDIAPPTADAPLKLVIEATADKCPPEEKHFLIWVDESKALRVEAN